MGFIGELGKGIALGLLKEAGADPSQFGVTGTSAQVLKLAGQFHPDNLQQAAEAARQKTEAAQRAAALQQLKIGDASSRRQIPAALAQLRQVAPSWTTQDAQALQRASADLKLATRRVELESVARQQHEGVEFLSGRTGDRTLDGAVAHVEAVLGKEPDRARLLTIFRNAREHSRPGTLTLGDAVNSWDGSKNPRFEGRLLESINGARESYVFSGYGNTYGENIDPLFGTHQECRRLASVLQQDVFAGRKRAADPNADPKVKTARELVDQLGVKNRGNVIAARVEGRLADKAPLTAQDTAFLADLVGKNVPAEGGVAPSARSTIRAIHKVLAAFPPVPPATP